MRLEVLPGLPGSSRVLVVEPSRWTRSRRNRRRMRGADPAGVPAPPSDERHSAMLLWESLAALMGIASGSQGRRAETVRAALIGGASVDPKSAPPSIVSRRCPTPRIEGVDSETRASSARCCKYGRVLPRFPERLRPDQYLPPVSLRSPSPQRCLSPS